MLYFFTCNYYYLLLSIDLVILSYNWYILTNHSFNRDPFFLSCEQETHQVSLHYTMMIPSTRDFGHRQPQIKKIFLNIFLEGLDLGRKAGIIHMLDDTMCINSMKGVLNMTRAFTELTRPEVKKTKQREKLNMTEQEARIRVEVRKATPKPSNTVKTDIIIYKHGAGRINYWITREDSANYDIVSYYFSHDTAEIKVFDDFNCIKIVKL